MQASNKIILQQLHLILWQISEWRQEDDENNDLYEIVKESARKYFMEIEDSILGKVLFERLILESKYDYEFINDLENYVLQFMGYYLKLITE